MAVAGPQPGRVVSIGGSVTEIVHALGEGGRLVARDSTSVYPDAVADLPDVGYIRALSPEGVLSVDPDMIIAEDGAGPPETVAILTAAALPFVMVPDDYTRAAVHAKIMAVADALGVPEKGAALAADTDAALERAAAASRTETPRRVLFVLSMQGGRILAAGRDTAADGIIALAGGVNAVTGFTGYKPLTDEAIVAVAPDIILMMDRRGDHAIADADLLTHPAIATTPAAQADKGAILRMDGLLLLGFGPRTPDAVTRLHAALYPDAD
nr:ABC transporter substrate-binding protein [Phycocomes zhengii]